PSVRGVARSYPKDKILSQIRTLSESGISEVVLTGTNVGSYGIDLDNYNLAKLINDINTLGLLKRLRVGSLEPSQINNELKEALEVPLMERHLHIALQHTSDSMLKIMNRLNRVESDLALFEDFAKKGFCLGSDFIIAHPGESESIWQEALEHFKRFPLTHLHPFIYSPREGTPSSAMKYHISGNVAKERLHTLKAIITQNNESFRKAHYVPLNVLCESKVASQNGFVYSGLDQFFNRMHFESQRGDLEGQWICFETYQISKEGNNANI
ncbi:radical SAM protein, partial [uncultured Helicobacter sp.]